MSRTMIVQVKCDLCFTPIEGEVEPVRLIDPTTHQTLELDLCGNDSERLVQVLAEFVDSARPVEEPDPQPQVEAPKATASGKRRGRPPGPVGTIPCPMSTCSQKFVTDESRDKHIQRRHVVWGKQYRPDLFPK